MSDSNSGGAPTHTDLADWIRWQPCLLSGYEPADGCSGDVICHHVRSRGAGYGDWRVTTDGRVVGNVTPLCTHHHRELHDRGRDTFERRYSLDLEHVARRYGEMDDAPEPPQRVRDRAQIREREDG